MTDKTKIIKDDQLTFRLPKTLKEKILKLAKKEDSISDFFRKLIDEQ